MGLFVRITLAVALGLVALTTLVVILKLLVVAALIAAIVFAGVVLVRFFRGRLGSRRRWVTTLTARR